MTNFNPYLGLNYSRFSDISGTPTGVSIFYTLSQLSGVTLAAVQALLAALLGPLGALPVLLAPPSIEAAAPLSTVRLESLLVGCTIRAEDPLLNLPFSCKVTIRPVEPSRSAESATCTYTPPATGFLQPCSVGLRKGAGFKFETTATVSLGELGHLQGLLDSLVEYDLVTVVDNLNYKVFC